MRLNSLQGIKLIDTKSLTSVYNGNTTMNQSGGLCIGSYNVFAVCGYVLGVYIF